MSCFLASVQWRVLKLKLLVDIKTYALFLLKITAALFIHYFPS